MQLEIRTSLLTQLFSAISTPNECVAQCGKQADEQKCQKHAIADSRIYCGWKGGRQGRVEDTDIVEPEPPDHPAIRVDHAGDAIICGADERQPLLDGARPRDRKMLERTRAEAEPRIVGDVEQPGRPVT